MNCAKSVKMIVILGCIVVNLVGCGMNDTTASSMSTVVSSQDTSPRRSVPPSVPCTSVEF